MDMKTRVYMYLVAQRLLHELVCCMCDRYIYCYFQLETQNGLDKSFHQIMHAYRYQPQAESRVSLFYSPSCAATASRLTSVCLLGLSECVNQNTARKYARYPKAVSDSEH